MRIGHTLTTLITIMALGAACGDDSNDASEASGSEASGSEASGSEANGSNGSGANGSGSDGSGGNGDGAGAGGDGPGAGGDGPGAGGDGPGAGGAGTGGDGAGANGAGGSPGSELDPEASEWLSEHNSRRESYHALYGVSYVPLKWSASLAASAQSYADEMAMTGVWAHSDSDYGENLAWNGGDQHAEISNVMTRWVEEEEASWGGHFTQVLWRATHYLGCGRASSSEHGSFQVCQYVTPGNCGSRDLENMTATTTGCLPECPPEGCF